MDYPVLGLAMELAGIDMIRQYLDAIWAKQCFLLRFEREEVIEKLRRFHPFYEKEFFNLKEMVSYSL